MNRSQEKSKQVKLTSAKHVTGKSTNQYWLTYTGQTSLEYGDYISTDVDTKDGTVAIFEVISNNKKTKTLRVRQLTPGIYVWTSRAYEAVNTYKVGMVGFQSFEDRFKQSNNTSMLYPLIEKGTWKLDTEYVTTNEQAVAIETKIHDELEDVCLQRCEGREGFELKPGQTYENTIVPIIERITKEIREDETSETPAPRYYQYTAAKLAFKHYLKNNKGWIQWTCGAGKSFGSYWMVDEIFKTIKDKNHGNNLVVLVPNKMLVDQFAADADYIAKCKGINRKALRVYSGEKGAASHDAMVSAINSGNSVIVSTYQSYDKVVSAYTQSNYEKASVVIGDEIHKTTGKETKQMRKAIRYVKAHKYLYMTASPVEFENNDHGFKGMENKQIYGECFHTYSYLEALLDDYVCGIKVHGVSCSPEKVEEVAKILNYKGNIKLQRLNWNADEANSQFYAQIYAVHENLVSGYVTHPIIYTNSIARGEAFKRELIKYAKHRGTEDIINESRCRVLTGKHASKVRITYLNDKFAKHDKSIVINARCLQEGISVNAADSVFIIDPRKSAVDIIQILGRIVRKNSNNRNKVGKVFLPMLLKYNEEGKLELDKNKFSVTRDWMLAILSTDSDFANYFTKDENSVSISFDNKERMGISKKEVDAPIDPDKVPGSRDGGRNPRAAWEMDENPFQDLVTSVMLETERSKIIKTTKVTKVKKHDNCRETFDVIRAELESLIISIEGFKVRNIKSYRELYNSNTEIIIEKIKENCNISELEITECLSTWSDMLIEIEEKRHELKIMSINALKNKRKELA